MYFYQKHLQSLNLYFLGNFGTLETLLTIKTGQQTNYKVQGNEKVMKVRLEIFDSTLQMQYTASQPTVLQSTAKSQHC